MTNFFDSSHLLSSKQFGFRSKKSASDLLLQLVTSLNKFPDTGKGTYVIVLNIAGAFARVWHNVILSRLKSFGVVVNCYSSGEHPVSACIPRQRHWPALMKVCFNDILYLIPEEPVYVHYLLHGKIMT